MWRQKSREYWLKLGDRSTRKYWDVVGNNVCSAVQEAFISGEIHPKLNYKFICLISQPKATGGLGIRRFEDSNRALIAKLAWNIAQGLSKPWIDCFLSKYCKHETFLIGKKKSSDSHLWKCILEARNIILKGSLALPAGGESIDIWSQPWIPWLEFMDFKNLMDSFRPRRYTARTIADLSTGNAWNKEVVLQFFGMKSRDMIVEIPRLPYPNRDRSRLYSTERKEIGTIQEVEWILCTDASWYKGEVELATVLINKNTDYWTKKTEYNKAISALDAELTAISMALSWALEEGRYEIHILSDCQIAVQALDKFLTSL
uniref:RNase H type-1 domain-containing protein n=1 Tax=Cannabis sativa TaxID=3483 RepID=A0A803P5A3_CANSA